MVLRIVPVGLAAIVLWAACVAACQAPAQFLPDAPSAQAAAEFGSSTLTHTQDPVLKAGSMRYADVVRQRDFSPLPETDLSRQDSAVFAKYLRPSSPKQQLTDPDGSLMTRATQAASRIFITQDDSGRGRLNASYFLRALTTVAASTASRPYYRRSLSDPFSNFGSTIGNDAGMNVLHEFEPGLQHLMKSHAPKFAARIAERIGHN